VQGLGTVYAPAIGKVGLCAVYPDKPKYLAGEFGIFANFKVVNPGANLSCRVGVPVDEFVQKGFVLRRDPAGPKD
jgi:hypothetical protein